MELPMATLIRPEITTKNKYYIDKHRYYELKHFCLQYLSWKKTYAALLELGVTSSLLEQSSTSGNRSDLTAKYAMRRSHYADRIKLIEQTAMDADEDLYIYILKAVTEGLSYTYLKTKLDIPCGKDMYYDRYRRFFWLLSESRN
jgi:hypothetical protein